MYEDFREKMWDCLYEVVGVSEETIRIVIDINGYNEDTLRDILYAKTGYRDFDQIEEDFYGEVDDEEDEEEEDEDEEDEDD